MICIYVYVECVCSTVKFAAYFQNSLFIKECLSRTASCRCCVVSCRQDSVLTSTQPLNNLVNCRGASMTLPHGV